MPERIRDRIRHLLGQADGLYHRLVLLVGETGSGKTAALRSVAGELGADVINVNLTLSVKLIELTERQRVLHLSALLSEVVQSTGAVALLDNTEILFDRDLKQDPLRLLQGLSRRCSIVASWNGRLAGKKLTYADAGHPEYRAYDRAEALIVDMNGTSGLEPQERGEA